MSHATQIVDEFIEINPNFTFIDNHVFVGISFERYLPLCTMF